jgi:plasmid stability protein
MVDILVRDVDAAVARELKKKAAAKGTSLSEAAREALAAYVKPNRQDIWRQADRLRRRIGKMSGDSTADIRADRANKGRHR